MSTTFSFNYYYKIEEKLEALNEKVDLLIMVVLLLLSSNIFIKIKKKLNFVGVHRP